MQQLNRLAEIKNFPIVPTDSDDYKKALHSLRLASGFTGVEIKDIRTIQDKSSEWEKVSNQKLTLESWIKYEDISNAYKEATFLKGAMFATGMVFKSPNDVEYETEYKYVQCLIAVGRSLTIKEGNQFPSSKMDIPDGYDSVYKISNSRKERSEDKDAIQEALFRHEYYIYDPLQVFPLKYVVFTIKQGQSQLEKDNYICSNCESATAEKYCVEDKAYLCLNCDNEIHESNEISKILRHHTRVPIPEKPILFDNCPEDKKEEIRFWCNECEKPLCVKCKMLNGSHSIEPYAGHRITKIKKVYKDAKSGLEKEDPSIKSKKSQIVQELKKIDAKRNEVQNKYKAIEEKIYAKMKELLRVLDMEVSKKLNILRSDECELVRRKEELEYWESFIKDSSAISPIQFIQMWVIHNKKKEELVARPIPVDNIQSEIKLEGDRGMRIVTDNSIKIQNIEYNIEKNKSELVEKSSILNSKMGQKEMASTKFRSSLMNKMLSDKNDKGYPNIYASSQLEMNAPSVIRMDDYTAQKDPNSSINSKNKGYVLKAIDEIDISIKGKNYKDSVSAEAYKRSIFGRFAETYKIFKPKIAKSDELLKLIPSVFKESTILNNTDKFVLYFNLPLTDSWFPKTKLIFHSDEQSQQSNCTITKFLTEFEHSHHQAPNIIIMTNDNEEEKFGGFASEAWKASSYLGNDTCFLFSINRNFRFECIKGKSHYIYACPDPQSLQFGGTDLVISQDFKQCVSKMEDHYTCGFSIYKKDIEKDTVLMGSQSIHPSKVEVWCLSN